MNPTHSTAFLLSFAVAATVLAQDPARQHPPGQDPMPDGNAKKVSRPKDPLAAAWYDARQLAARHKAPILAFVLPKASAAASKQRIAATRAAEKKAYMLMTMGGAAAPIMRTQRDVLLRQVQFLRGRQRGTLASLPKALPAQMVFALTVPVFATAESCAAKPGENLVLLSAMGERVVGWQVDLLDGEAFVKAVGARVFAKPSLAPRQANVSAQAQKALVDVRRQKIAKGQGRMAPFYEQQMLSALAAHLVALGPALVHREGGKLVAASELGGIETSRPPLGSTAHMDLGDPCPGCGMGYTPPGLLTVLKLVGP